MIELVECNERIDTIDYEYCYKLVKDDKEIGLCTINKNKQNVLYIFIRKELRGNGYGKILFSKMVDKLKELGYKDASLIFSKTNIPILKIVTDNGGIHISTDKDTVKYIIPLQS